MNKLAYMIGGLLVFTLICLTALGVLKRQLQRSNSAGAAVSPRTVTSTTPQMVFVISPQQPQQGVQVVPVQQTHQPTQQASRTWKRYRSARLGFSIDYPSDSFVPLDGRAQGEPNVISFLNKDGTSNSAIQVNVDPTSYSNATQDIDLSNPYTITTLGSLPATEQDEGSGGCPDCDVRFISVSKGNLYIINIFDDQPGPDYLSLVDIEHIRQSFALN